MKMERKRLFALFILVTFLLSTIAFVVVGITGSNFFAQQQQQAKQLDSYILDEDVDAVTELDYLKRGFTFLKYHYSDSPPPYLDSLPTAMPAGNDVQLFVVKVRDTESYARIINAQNDFVVENVTQENVVMELCLRLLVTPIECSFLIQQFPS